jgi:hypothetical protein
MLVDAELLRDSLAREREPVLVLRQRLDERRSLAGSGHARIVCSPAWSSITRTG